MWTTRGSWLDYATRHSQASWFSLLVSASSWSWKWQCCYILGFVLFLARSHHCGAENEVQRKPSLFRCCFSVEVVLHLEKKKKKKKKTNTPLWLLLSHPLLFFFKSKNLSRCMWPYGADSYWVGNWMQYVICKLNKKKTCLPFWDKGFIFYLNLTSSQAVTHFSSYPYYNMLTHWITVIVKSSHFSYRH